MSVPLKDLVALESVFFSMAETQSMEMWLIATLLVCLHQALDLEADMLMFERLCQTFSSAAVRLHALGAKASAFLVYIRRSLYISHMPPSVMLDQKLKLHASSPFTGLLFDEDILDSLISDHKSDSATSVNLKLASSLEMVIPAILGKGKKRPAHSTSSDVGFKGSPLAGHPAAASGSKAPTFVGHNTYKGGRGRGSGSGGGNQKKVNPKTPKNSSQGFQA